MTCAARIAKTKNCARKFARLELRNRELENRAAEGDRLTALLGFRQEHFEIPMLAAEVIGGSADPGSKAVYINRGTHDGVRKNMGVITPAGVVGKIAEAFPHASQVLLLTDRDSGVGALLADSRTHGVVKGTGDPLVRMEYVVNDEKIPGGESVVTSGEDRIFPKDLPIGTVAETKNGNPFQAITIRPSARLDRLEDVIVLLTLQELNLKKETATPAAEPPDKPVATPTTNPPAPAAKPPGASPGATGSTAGTGGAGPATGPDAAPAKPTTTPAAPPPEEKKPPR